MRLRSPAPVRAGGIGMCALALWSCATAPGIVALPDAAEPDWTAASAPADELRVVPRDADGYRGGEIAATMPAPADAVLAMLTDFEHADGHRAWARHHRVISREGDQTVARWDFAGKLGINPSIELVFERAVERGVPVVRFRQREAVFGLAAFFGDYRVLPAADRPDRSLLIARVFIDSGLPFVGASEDDIAAGLREDVRRLREWLLEQDRG